MTLEWFAANTKSPTPISVSPAMAQWAKRYGFRVYVSDHRDADQRPTLRDPTPAELRSLAASAAEAAGRRPQGPGTPPPLRSR